ncbi:hypothetical protein VU08_02795, partial [Desulfobulbus sp. F5]|nr:hypothetical protein [Desulfobulbus sp. F5]
TLGNKDNNATNAPSTPEGYKLESPDNLKDFLLPLVEFFGILVPGVIFMISLVPAIMIPLAIAFEMINSQIKQAHSHTDILSGGRIFYNDIAKYIFIFTKEGFSSIYGLLFLIISYVVGYIFFRQDIKVPDRKSFEKTPQKYKTTGPILLKPVKKLCLIDYYYCKCRGIYPQSAEDVDKYEDCAEFPYGDLKSYLNKRGLYHLSNMIRWGGSNEDNYKYKTKHFVNILKIRLEFLFPRQYVKIQKNKAHVRLMSSIWYVSDTMIDISSVLLATGLFSCFVIIISSTLVEKSLHAEIFLYIISPIFAVYLVYKYIKSKIENLLHHQRIRELIYILESAYFANQLCKHLNINMLDTEKGSPGQDDSECG